MHLIRQNLYLLVTSNIIVYDVGPEDCYMDDFKPDSGHMSTLIECHSCLVRHKVLHAELLIIPQGKFQNRKRQSKQESYHRHSGASLVIKEKFAFLFWCFEVSARIEVSLLSPWSKAGNALWNGSKADSISPPQSAFFLNCFYFFERKSP